MANEGEANANVRRGSLFEVHRTVPANVGSSMTSFAYEPHPDDDAQRRQKRVFYENTYRTEAPCKFSAGKVETIIEEVLEKHLKDEEYECLQCSASTKTITQEILLRVKELNMTRYKVVCQVILGQKQDQDARIGSRCVWDTARDNYAQATFENTHIFALGIVHGIYFE